MGTVIWEIAQSPHSQIISSPSIKLFDYEAIRLLMPRVMGHGTGTLSMLNNMWRSATVPILLSWLLKKLSGLVRKWSCTKRTTNSQKRKTSPNNWEGSRNTVMARNEFFCLMSLWLPMLVSLATLWMISLLDLQLGLGHPPWTWSWVDQPAITFAKELTYWIILDELQNELNNN